MLAGSFAKLHRTRSQASRTSSHHSRKSRGSVHSLPSRGSKASVSSSTAQSNFSFKFDAQPDTTASTASAAAELHTTTASQTEESQRTSYTLETSAQSLPVLSQQLPGALVLPPDFRPAGASAPPSRLSEGGQRAAAAAAAAAAGGAALPPRAPSLEGGADQPPPRRPTVSDSGVARPVARSPRTLPLTPQTTPLTPTITPTLQDPPPATPPGSEAAPFTLQQDAGTQTAALGTPPGYVSGEWREVQPWRGGPVGEPDIVLHPPVRSQSPDIVRQRERVAPTGATTDRAASPPRDVSPPRRTSLPGEGVPQPSVISSVSVADSVLVELGSRTRSVHGTAWPFVEGGAVSASWDRTARDAAAGVSVSPRPRPAPAGESVTLARVDSAASGGAPASRLSSGSHTSTGLAPEQTERWGSLVGAASSRPSLQPAGRTPSNLSQSEPYFLPQSPEAREPGQGSGNLGYASRVIGPRQRSITLPRSPSPLRRSKEGGVVGERYPLQRSVTAPVALPQRPRPTDAPASPRRPSLHEPHSPSRMSRVSRSGDPPEAPSPRTARVHSAPAPPGSADRSAALNVDAQTLAHAR